MKKTPTIGGVKMKKLGKGKPGRMKNLVTRHLGKSAGAKLTKSDGARLMAKGKKTGNVALIRKGSFIKNMMREAKADMDSEAQKNYNTPAAKHKAEKTYPRFAALTDLDLNTKNRNETIKEYSYGPANPGDEEGSKLFWERKADLWNAPVEQVKSMRCNNCNAFNQTPEVKKKMADALGPKGETIVRESELGYCEFFEFKCAGARTCDAWVGGGPITEQGKGLYYNIHMKRRRGEKMRKAGAKGAPKPSDFERAKTTARESKMKSFTEFTIGEKKLTPAELKKREEIAQAIKRDNPKMPMDKKMAIATATAKRVAEETTIGGKTFDDLELCPMAVKAFNKDYKESENKQAVLDAAQAVDNYLAIERKGLKGNITSDDLGRMKELVQVAKKKISDAGLSASDHDYHQGHIETVQDLLKKQKINEALALRPLRARGQVVGAKEDTQIPDKDEKKLAKIVKNLKKSVKAHDKQQKTIQKVLDKDAANESMYKSPAHARLQKHMDKIRKTKSYQQQVTKLGGTPLKPGEQNPMKRTTNEEACCDDCKYDHVISEAMYQGKTVKLNDPIRTSEVPTKKFKVYVKDGDKVKVVRFGDPGLSIKRDDPDRRKSFRARHNCDNPGPKTKPRYWSCFQWRSGSKVDN